MVKSEIDKVQDEYLGVLFRLIKSLERYQQLHPRPVRGGSQEV
jgi:hypothetical protein